MIRRPHLLENAEDFLIGADGKGCALGSHVCSTEHPLFAPDTVGIDHFVIFVADQRERQTMLLDETLMAFNAADVYSEKFYL